YTATDTSGNTATSSFVITITDGNLVTTGDCNSDGVSNFCEIAADPSLDCNGNGVPDECDLWSGVSIDQNGNGIPDECECFPVVGLTATYDVTNEQTTLTWTITADPSGYQQFQVLRNGTEIGFLPPTASDFTDLEPLCPGVTSYSVSADCVSGIATTTVEITYIPEAPVRYGIDDATIEIPENWSAVDFEVEPWIHQETDDPGCSYATTGFSMGVGHPETLEVTAVGLHPELVNRVPSGIDFYSVDLLDSGWTLGVVYSLVSSPSTGLDTLDFLTKTRVATARYRSACGIDMQTGATLGFVDTLGTPPVENRVVVNGFGLSPEHLQAGTITLMPVSAQKAFLRGDCNGDQVVMLTDVFALLTFLFNTYGMVQCADACDANDSEALDIADPLYLLFYLYAMGPPPEAPSGECGVDPTMGSLGCQTAPPCGPCAP
ncbi:MAG: hypothetical protein ACO4BJ_12170, partial [Planctomycetota bacterium]